MFLHQAALAVLLVVATLWLQCVGIATLIAWTKSVAAGNIHVETQVNSLNKLINNRARSLQLNMNIQSLITSQHVTVSFAYDL
jgi:hypothetical protein